MKLKHIVLKQPYLHNIYINIKHIFLKNRNTLNNFYHFIIIIHGT